MRSVDVKSRGGLGLFNYYRTLGDALQSTYTDYAWDPKRFVPEMRRHSTLLKELDRAESKLGINQVLISEDGPNLFTNSNQAEDWYSVSLAELKDVGFRAKVTKSKLIELLSEKYPDHKWDKLYLLRGKYGQQKKLERAVISLFPVDLPSLSMVK